MKEQTSEFYSKDTFELPANRKARRDVARRNGAFKKRKPRVKRGEAR